MASATLLEIDFLFKLETVSLNVPRRGRLTQSLSLAHTSTAHTLTHPHVPVHHLSSSRN